ncbi:hypothetical protein ACFX19_014603 [Malus domestica]
MFHISGCVGADFVIFLGDVITANNILIENASLYRDQAISPRRARGIPCASVFGNHDDAAFVWPIEWFSSPGIPEIRCRVANEKFIYHVIVATIMNNVGPLYENTVASNFLVRKLATLGVRNGVCSSSG